MAHHSLSNGDILLTEPLWKRPMDKNTHIFFKKMYLKMLYKEWQLQYFMLTHVELGMW